MTGPVGGPPAAGEPALAIVVVAHNAHDELARCLASLAAAPPALVHEIIVVDNGSIDGGADMVRARWPLVRVIAQDNRGFAAGCNVGIRASRAGLILLLNPDTVVPPGAIDRLVARLEAFPEAAVAGPRLLDSDGLPELTFGRMLSPFVELRQKTLVYLLARRFAPVVSYVRRLTAVDRHPDWVSGACLLTRRTEAEAVGLLDERFFLYTEDVDFCAAIRSRGKTVLFTPAAEIVHVRGRSRATAPREAERAYRASQLAFYRKHRPGWVPWLRLYLRLRGRLPS